MTGSLRRRPERGGGAAHAPSARPGAAGSIGGSPTHALTESWLGGRLAAPNESLRTLLVRYLSTFGSASVKDIQTCSGLVRLTEPIEELKSELRIFGDENGDELLDLPDAPLPPAHAPAPPRFVPEYDNLVLAHADRTPVIAHEHRSRVFLSATRVRPTFLLDDFVGGTWKIESTKGAAAFLIYPFEPLPEAACDTLLEEGERLIRFVEDDAEAFEVRLSH